jgi:hypothetical protein
MVSEASSSPAPAPRRARLDLYAAAGGGVLVVAGAVLYGAAVWRFEDAKTACNQGAGCPDRDSRATTIEALEYTAFGCWIAGGGLLLASGLQYWFERTKAPLAVSFDPHRNTLLVGAAF